MGRHEYALSDMLHSCVTIGTGQGRSFRSIAPCTGTAQVILLERGVPIPAPPALNVLAAPFEILFPSNTYICQLRSTRERRHAIPRVETGV